MAFFRTYISPTTCRRLSLTTKIHGPIENFNQIIASLLKSFLAKYLGQEQHREPMTIRITLIVVWVANQSVLARLTEQIVGSASDLLGIRSLSYGRAAAKQRKSSKSRNCNWIGRRIPQTSRRLGSG